MKGQSQIIQFMLFFFVGLSVFLAISGVYKSELDIFGNTVSSKDAQLMNSFVSENFIYERSCLSCDTINVTINPQNPEGIFLQTVLNSTSLQVVSYPNLQSTYSAMHNTLYSVATAIGQASTGQPIILSFIKTQNMLRVGQ